MAHGPSGSHFSTFWITFYNFCGSHFVDRSLVLFGSHGKFGSHFGNFWDRILVLSGSHFSTFWDRILVLFGIAF